MVVREDNVSHAQTQESYIFQIVFLVVPELLLTSQNKIYVVISHVILHVNTALDH